MTAYGMAVKDKTMRVDPTVMHGSRPGDFASATDSLFEGNAVCLHVSERSTARRTMTHVEAALHQPG